MKKSILAIVAVAAILVGCNEESKNDAVLVQEQEIDMSNFYVETEELQHRGASNKCHSMLVLNRQLKENPGLYKKMYDVEYATRKTLAKKGKPGGNGGSGDVDITPIADGLGIINIPIYVHVVYSNSQQNISNTQIASQIKVLNDDFRANNNDLNLPSGTTFENDVTDAEIEFTLAGTYRYSDSRAEWGTRDDVKKAYPPITPETHLNIWVANIGGGILGYAQFPGGTLTTDGVVCAPQYFGNTGYVEAPFNKGRTMTHEVGHYLNLRHIWGDGRCRQDDFVADTPSSDAPNYGCPSYPTTNCKTTDMTMNYMDYTNDACMYMFTDGQRNRMRAIFAAGGARSSMI
ncbi:Zinc metalloprotease [Tenacibaculum sp. 190524A02b]|uniref:Zinc metalloprotease n=1 Tax=Tenacibaculum vairaonense TaxID=3137860 RepID=A0ABM9PMG8_9FLAO